MQARFDLIAFDWDGTIVDSTTAIADSIRHAAADLGLEVPNAERASHVIGLGLQDALRIAVPTLPSARMNEFIERYRVHYFGRDPLLRPFSGIPELLQGIQAAGLTMAVATGKSRVGLERAFDQTGLRQHFAASRCADEGHSKPHPWMLLDLCDELSCAPDRVLMIGDTTHDHTMACAAGAQFAGVGYGAHAPEVLLAAGVDPVHLTVPQLTEWIATQVLPEQPAST
jgi:phosphoglycolate phosphatase